MNVMAKAVMMKGMPLAMNPPRATVAKVSNRVCRASFFSAFALSAFLLHTITRTKQIRAE